MKEIVWGGEELGAKVHLSLLDLLVQMLARSSAPRYLSLLALLVQRTLVYVRY